MALLPGPTLFGRAPHTQLSLCSSQIFVASVSPGVDCGQARKNVSISPALDMQGDKATMAGWGRAGGAAYIDFAGCQQVRNPPRCAHGDGDSDEKPCDRDG